MRFPQKRPFRIKFMALYKNILRTVHEEVGFTKDDVVVILYHDHGSRYVGKFFNDEWMASKGWLENDPDSELK